jgi:hypothetical protein
MESELGDLALTAATTLVTAMTTGAWELAKKGVGSLWRRVHPDRAETVEAELAEARAELVTARRDGNDQVEGALVDEWRSRLGRLLTTDPELAAEIHLLIDTLKNSAESSDQTRRVDMRARASGHGRVYQAGRDQQINER